MPANNPSPASKAPPSPDSKNVSRYANKDGSKFIALPKTAAADIPEAPALTPATMPATQASVVGPASNGPPPGVNTKKQKRRQKLAAKAAAAAAANGPASPATSANTGHASADAAIENEDEADDPRPLPQAHPSHSHSSLPNGTHPDADDAAADELSKKGKKKKKNKKKGAAPGVPEQPEAVAYRQHHEVARSQANDRFWNTNSNEERERIKAFWISLSEDERKNLVKLEKDTILKKMKEQQKNTCSCAVCGRKRSAIEQELEGLYDSYYRELENYANRADGSLIGGPGNFALQPPREPHMGYPAPVPARGRLVEHVHEVEDDEEDSYVEEEYEDEDEVYSEDELSDDGRRPDDRVIADFLDFGNSLQVKGGILTVADDLLKNDGRKFIEMMEQLAERRMARDEAPPGHYPRIVGGHRSNGYLPPHNHIHDDEDELDHDHDHEHDHHHDHDHHDHIHDHDHGHIHDHEDHLHDHLHDHHHLHPDDDPEGEYAEDDEEEYDESQEGEYDDEDDEVEEAMTDQQRMEEGRRMFQIFAARMFEQRVLSAYKKKLASERTEKLLQELDDEKRLEEERKAQKASKAAKKRDRERQKKLAAQEAKAKREADKAAEEAARKAEAEKRAEEQRRQVEEKRRAKEAQRKREEEERHRKEAERLKRAQEQERRAQEAREAKERERRAKDEQKVREKEAREAKERHARELKETQQKEREQKDREARERRDRQEVERQRKQDKEKPKAQAKAAAAKAAAQTTLPKGAKRQSQQPQVAPQPEKQPPTTISLPQHPAPASTAIYASPKFAVATPIMPPRAVAHPIRSRTSSQQQDSTAASHQSSATSHSGSPHTSTPAHSSPGAIGQGAGHAAPGMPIPQQAPQSGSPSVSSLRASLNAASPPPFPIGRGAGMPPPPPGFQMPMPPGLQSRMPQDQVFPPGQAGFRYGPDMMHLPPGLAPPLGRAGYGGPPPPPGFSQPADPLLGLNPGFGLASEMAPPQRQMSGSMDPLAAPPLGQPINRPTPIGRPSSVVHGQRGQGLARDSEEESEHLGSRALLDDEPDDPVSLGQGSLPRRAAPGPGIRTQFPPPSGFMDAAFASPFHTQWGSPSGSAFTPQSALGGSLWSAGTNHFPAAPGAPLRARPPVNAVALRHMLCQACQTLRDGGQATGEGYVDFSAAKSSICGALGHDVADGELLAISETEGSPQNGGGSFDSVGEGGKRLIRWVSGAGERVVLGAPGDIGSPVIGAGRS